MSIAAGSHSILTGSCGSSGQRLDGSRRESVRRVQVSCLERLPALLCPSPGGRASKCSQQTRCLHQASCPSHPRWESLLYNLAVLQASWSCSLIACLLVCFCCNTLTPADSMGGKGRLRNLVAFAVFPDRRIPKHFFFPYIEQA